MKTDSPVGKAVADYTGRTLTKLLSAPDPLVSTCTAFRASFEDGKEDLDFIITGIPLSRATAEDIEEMTFETWPPKSEGKVTGWLVS